MKSGVADWLIRALARSARFPVPIPVAPVSPEPVPNDRSRLREGLPGLRDSDTEPSALPPQSPFPQPSAHAVEALHLSPEVVLQRGVPLVLSWGGTP